MSKQKKRIISEKKIKQSNSAGEKFEDLDPEEMKKYQGSGNGDVKPEDITNITTLLSKGNYKC